jgi:tetratricopeptide (TPR) repeat protein
LGRGRHSDAISRARLAVELSPDDPERGQGNVVLGEILTGRWRGDEAIAAYRAAVDAFERVGDAVAAARPRALLAEVTLRWAGTVSTPTPLAELDALIDAGLAVEDRLEVGVASELWAMRAVRGQRVGHLDAAEQAALRAVELAERSGDAVLVSGALDALSAIQLAQERYADAETTSACRVQLLPRLPATARGVMEHADILMMRSDCTLRVGDFRTALEVSEQLVRFEGDRGLRLAGLARLARVRFFVGRWDEALADVDSIVADWERQERPAATYLAAALGAAAAIRGLRGDLTAMREMLATARATLRWRTTHTRWLAVAEAIVPLASGRPDQALEVLRPAVEGSDAWRSTVLAMLAEASVAVGADDADERMAAASQAVRGDRYAEAILWRAAGERERAAAAFAALPCPWQASMTLPR